MSYELLNEIETILGKAILEHAEQNNSFKITPYIPDLAVQKLVKKIDQLQTLEVIGKERTHIVEYLNIALRNLVGVTDKAKLKLIAESIGDIHDTAEFERMRTSPSPTDVNKQQISDYAINIMKNYGCDVYEALACAMKDCEPGDCELDDQYHDKVSQTFNEEEIQDITNRARGIHEACSMNNEYEESNLSTLSPEEKQNIIQHAAQELREQPGADVYEILGMMIENIPGLEYADVSEIFSDEDIARINQMSGV